MPTVMFSCGTINRRGICRAIAGRWIKFDKRLMPTGVTKLDEFMRESGERYKQTKRLWNRATDNDDIDQLTGLVPAERKVVQGKELDPAWVGRNCASGRWYGILAARGTEFALKVGSSKHKDEGHAMAFSTIAGHYRFLDPNENCWSFTNSFDMVSWLPGFLSRTYPTLFNDELDIIRFAP
jgi:hypothetical protein